MSNTIIENLINDLKQFDSSKLRQISRIVRKLRTQPKKDINGEKILSFAGIWKDLDVDSFVDDIYERRLISLSRRDRL